MSITPISQNNRLRQVQSKSSNFSIKEKAFTNKTQNNKKLSLDKHAILSLKNQYISGKINKEELGKNFVDIVLKEYPLLKDQKLTDFVNDVIKNDPDFLNSLEKNLQNLV